MVINTFDSLRSSNEDYGHLGQFISPERSIRLTRNIIDKLSTNKKINKTLLVHSMNADVFEKIPIENHMQSALTNCDSNFFYEDIKGKDKYDFILGALPFNVQMGGQYKESKFKDIAIDKLLTSIDFLNEYGYGLFHLPNMEKIINKKYNLEEELLFKDFHINSIFKLPKAFNNFTSISGIYLLVSKNKNPNNKILFVDIIHYDSEHLDIALNNLLNNNEDDNYLSKGVFSKLQDFSGFDNWYLEKELRELVSDYKKFNKYQFKDFSKIKLINLGSKIKETNDSIFIPKIGIQRSEIKVEDLKIKHHNYLQVEITDKNILKEYIVLFLNSDYGKLLLSTVRTGNIIKNINKSSLESLEINIPDLDTQKQILNNLDRLNSIREYITQMENSISLNPISSPEDLNKLDKITDIFEELTEPDKIKRLIRYGESKTLEFKQSLSLNIHTKQKDNAMEHAVIKSIAGFMNADGGELLIGVEDSGKITGIDTELNMFYKASSIQIQIDKFLQHFLNLFNKKIGDKFHNLVNYKVLKIDDNHIFSMTCNESDEEIFVDNTYFIRSNPATIALEGKAMIDYINQRKKEKGNLNS